METNRQRSALTNRWLPAALALMLLVSCGAVAIGSAAGTTSISVTPTDGSVDAGETTTFDVVLKNADGGVQSAELSVALGNASVASITDASIHGEPGFTHFDYADDNSSVDVAYTAADTADTGSVTFLTVTVEGTAAGTTGLSIEPRASNDAVVVFDEAGAGYDLSAVDDATLTVEETSDDSGDGSDGTDGNSGSGDDGADDGDTDTGTDAVNVSIAPEDASVAPGKTTTFDVIVDSADVGAVNLTMSLADGSVATIESIDTPAGDGSEDISNDGQTASIEAYGLQDAGQDSSTTVATVTVTGTNAGSTALSVDSAAVFGVQGNQYDTNVDGGASLTVADTDGSGDETDGGNAGTVDVNIAPENASIAPGETTTFDVIVDSTDVGAVDFTVSLADESVATIESVDTPAGNGSEDISNDGQTATIAAYGLQDTGQDGSTTISTVTVSGASTGSTVLSFGEVQVSDIQGNTYDTTIGDDASLTVLEPADLQVADLSVGSETVAAGDSITLTATVENVGGVEGTETVDFTVDGETVATEDVTVGASDSTTVTVEIDSNDYVLGEHDVTASVGDSTASTSFAVEFPALSDELAPPTNLNDDAVLEDVNGDGVFDAGDATALFANRDGDLVQNHPTQFDFNGDGSVNVFDVQAAFYQAVLNGTN